MSALQVKLQPEGFYSIEVTTLTGATNIIALADTESEAKNKVKWLVESGHLQNTIQAANS